ncbi:MAG: hypothetical protein NUV82_03350 [Candidatus Komeilibacteria bacterium]|nr:hypothetical protein [Candidatus Komeilibacteria bacterium]
MTNEEQINKYLNDTSTKARMMIVGARYDQNIPFLAREWLKEELPTEELADFLREEMNMADQAAEKLAAEMTEHILEPYYAYLDGDEQIVPKVNKKEPAFDWQTFLEDKNLDSHKKELAEASGGDRDKIIDFLWKSIGLAKPDVVLVVLCYLAEQGELLRLWQADNRFNGILRKYVRQNYSLENYTPAAVLTPAELSVVFQMVFVDKLGQDMGLAASLATVVLDHLPAATKIDYLLIVYTAEESADFVWTTVRTRDGQLVLE